MVALELALHSGIQMQKNSFQCGLGIETGWNLWLLGDPSQYTKSAYLVSSESIKIILQDQHKNMYNFMDRSSCMAYRNTPLYYCGYTVIHLSIIVHEYSTSVLITEAPLIQECPDGFLYT